MKPIGILTAGGDTPVLNAAIAGDVAPANLTQPYHSINTDVNKRSCFLEELQTAG